MKPILSWLLLAIITCHWVGSYIGFKVIYKIEVESKMSEAEESIAEIVKEETSLEAHITILDEDEIQMRGNGYGNFYVFSKEIDGKTVYYQIDPTPVKVVEHEYVATANPHEEEHEKIALFEHFFSKYTIPKTHFKAVPPYLTSSEVTFNVIDLRNLLFPTIPTPPPDLV